MAKLKPRQNKTILHIVEAKNISEGLEAAGIPRSTFYRWMRDPVFVREFAECRHAVFQGSRSELEKLFKRSVEVLGELLETGKEDTRRLAAVSIINAILKVKELDVQDRINEFIERLEDLQQ